MMMMKACFGLLFLVVASRAMVPVPLRRANSRMLLYEDRPQPIARRQALWTTFLPALILPSIARAADPKDGKPLATFSTEALMVVKDATATGTQPSSVVISNCEPPKPTGGAKVCADPDDEPPPDLSSALKSATEKPVAGPLTHGL